MLFFFLLVRVGGLASAWIFPPPSRCGCQDARREAARRLHTCARRSRETSAGRQAGRQPPLGFLFLIGTHPPAGHHVSLITSSHLWDGRHKLTGRPKGLCCAPTRTGATPACAVRTAQPFQSRLEVAKKENPPGCNELESLPHCNLPHKGAH